MTAKKCAWFTVAIVCAALSHCEMAGQALNDPSPRVRRQAILDLVRSNQASVDALARMLDDKDVVVRRTATRELARLGKPAMPVLAKASASDDMGVRRIAIGAIGGMDRDAVPYLAKALKDKQALVRQSAVAALGDVRPGTEAILKMLEEATKDEDPVVQSAAQTAVDRYFEIVESIRLPAEGWAFSLDPETKGKEAGWFKPEFDDSKWKRLSIEKTWEDQGFQYDGVAWYRRKVDLPKKQDAGKVMLHFGSVDECAWVWINGQFAGEHDIGPSGWNKPFRIDVTPLVRWGEANQITVRVLDSAAAGGIWLPVNLHVLRLRQ